MSARSSVRAVGYARISIDSDASTSLERQTIDIQQCAARQGWELVDVISDPGLSATKTRLNRPGIHTIQGMINRREIDVVIVRSIDRLARNVIDVSVLIQDRGWRVMSATEPFDATTDQGVAMLQMAAVFGRLEAQTIGARVKSMRSHLPTVGRWPGGAPPFGFTTGAVRDASGTEIGRTLVHDPEEARAVRFMIEQALAGKSLNSIARDLSYYGHRTRRGAAAWGPPTVARILRHGSLRGWATLARDYVRDERGLPAVVWPPYLSAEEAAELDRVMALARVDPAARINTGETPLLRGLVLCSSCGRAMTPRTSSNANRALLYRCMSRARGYVCEKPQTVTAAPADAEAERQFLEMWGSTEVIETVQVPRELTALREVTAEADRVWERMRTARGEDERRRLFDTYNQLVAERDRLASLSQTVPEERRTGRTIRDEWAAADVNERRRLMTEAQAYVWIYPAAARGRFNADRVVVSDERAPAHDEDTDFDVAV